MFLLTVSPELSYLGKIQDDNKSEHKVVEEVEGEEEENKKDQQDDINDSNSNNVARGVQSLFNLGDLIHILTIIYGFGK